MGLERENKLYGHWNYPIAKEICELQQDNTWTAQEVAVADDIDDYKSNMTDKQRKLVETLLQSFMDIEQHVGDVWLDIARWWKQPDIEMAAIEIGRMEKCVHAPFYQAMSDVLLIEPEEIYINKQRIKPIREKLEFIGRILAEPEKNKLVALGALALTEQVLLFGNFAVLKSFQSNGTNLIPNTISGVQMVVFDEGLHGKFAEYLFHELSRESLDQEMSDARETIVDIAGMVIEHEFGMIDLLFDNSDTINGLNKDDLKLFITERSNIVLSNLKIVDNKEEAKSDIASWFYHDVNSIRSFDFFASTGNQYTRDWSKPKFKRIV